MGSTEVLEHCGSIGGRKDRLYEDCFLGRVVQDALPGRTPGMGCHLLNDSWLDV